MFDEKKYDVSELEDSVNELEFPFLTRPYPVKCLPDFFTSKDWLAFFLAQARCFRKMKGILVNTVAELEPHALKMFNSGDVAALRRAEDKRLCDGGGVGIGGSDTEVL
jgi:hypothetical protein